MFGMVEALKEDLADQKVLHAGRSHSDLNPAFRTRIGKATHLQSQSMDMIVPDGFFPVLEQRVLVSRKLARWTGDGHLQLTSDGMLVGLAQEHKSNLPAVVKPKSTAGTMLQAWVRDARADLQAMATTPFYLDKWWWRSTMWNLRRWWAGTSPSARPLIESKVIEVRAPWTEADELARFRLWNESHYTAFWLCPDGVEAGLEKLNEFEAKAVSMGPNAWQVIDAVESIARLAGQLPPPKPTTVVEEIQKRMFDKSGDFKFEEFADRYGKVLNVRWDGESGKGKSYGVAGADSAAFISIHDGKVGATEEAKRLADIQAGRDFDETTRKTRTKKPKQFQLIDQFSKAFGALEQPDNSDAFEGYCHNHIGCDCPKVLPTRQTRAPMPAVKPPKKSKK